MRKVMLLQRVGVGSEEGIDLLLRPAMLRDQRDDLVASSPYATERLLQFKRQGV